MKAGQRKQVIMPDTRFLCVFDMHFAHIARVKGQANTLEQTMPTSLHQCCGGQSPAILLLSKSSCG